MATAKFKIGDLVELKSGGPAMTVTEPVGNANVWCKWFAGKKAEQSLFPVDSLKPATIEKDSKAK